jgi:hypothetical protein
MQEDNIFGQVTPPQAVQDYDQMSTSSGAGGIGILLLFSNLLRLFTIVAGLYVLYNFISAGYLYITGSGDTGAHAKVKEKLTWSVMGLVVIVLAYTIIGIIGLVFFGNAGFILSPEIIGPESVTNPIVQ